MVFTSLPALSEAFPCIPGYARCDCCLILLRVTKKNYFVQQKYFFFFFFFFCRAREVFHGLPNGPVTCYRVMRWLKMIRPCSHSIIQCSCLSILDGSEKLFRLSVKYAANYFWISPILVDFSGSNLPKNSCDSFSDSPFHADASPILIIHIFRRLIFFISEVAYRTKPRAQYFSDPAMKIFPILQKCHTRC